MVSHNRSHDMPVHLFDDDGYAVIGAPAGLPVKDRLVFDAHHIPKNQNGSHGV